MDEMYEKLSTGVIHQTRYHKIKYTYDYSNKYNSFGERGIQFAFLRLGVLMGALGTTPASLLDVGYGNGDFLKVASQIIPHCYGADISDYPPPPQCQKVDLKEHRFYDVICFFDSLEHFDDIDFLRDLDCGHIFISVPWCHYFTESWFHHWYHRRPHEHLWHFNKSALISHFSAHGYDCIYSSHYEDMVRKNPESANYPNILSCLFKKRQTLETRLVEFYSDKTVVVTGGTGFIGRHIVDALLSQPIRELHILDRTLQTSWTDPRVHMIPFDLATVKSIPFEILFHDAAADEDTILFEQLVALCQEKKATFVSGNSSSLMIDQYSTSSSPVLCLRYFNVYGNGEEMSMVSRMIGCMRENKNVRLFDWGDQRRDFIHVKDVVRCNLLAGMSSASGIYDCGCGESVSFNELFTIISSFFRNESSIEYIHHPHEFVQVERKADMDLTRAVLGFIPHYTIQKGVYDVLKKDY